ncbi:MAG TPA: DEAD/DEAH box helicase [Pirellulaceae bacterium]|nr:DEAD/DEAH box helicase [Pirellulaceae bacterium]
MDHFHPLIWQWFLGRFGAPTEPQAQGWPHIAAGEHTLIAAPTGSGKTLAAFLVCLDRLFRQWIEGTLPDGIDVVYVSPLKALSNDIERNLRVPLEEICQLAADSGLPGLPIRVAVRTGDTPASQRQSMLRKPPHILVTTPESLYLLLTSVKSRAKLRTVRTVIVDEIHALARDKRGSHLTLTLERLEALCDQSPTRIGLSATQKPIEEIAQFLVGQVSNLSNQAAGQVENLSHAQIVNIGHSRQVDLALEVPPSELEAVCSAEQWGEIYDRLVQLVQTHRSTLVFVNTRRLAERVALRLRELLGEEAVASHHGSLSRQIRHDAEQRLKEGKLKAIVATASLEMGIDIGYIDLVCQIGSPRSIATFLQRVGRSGHSLGALPKGRLFPLTRDELLESLALVRAVRRGELDRIEIPQTPLDILAQQVVAAVACDEWDENALLELVRRAWPFRNLKREDYDAVLKMLSDGIKPGSKAGTYLHRDQIYGKLRARRHARLAALTSGGAIPEQGEYRVIEVGEGTFVGTVNEDFAIESLAGDIFLLGNTSWRIQQVTSGEVLVTDAKGAPPSIPFWLGEAPGRTVELSAELSDLRRGIAERVQITADADFNPQSAIPNPHWPDAVSWLIHECGTEPRIAEQAARYVAAQKAAIGIVPTKDQIVFERFFDESGGMQLVVHAPLGSRINRAWGLALRKRFCRSFDFELQAAADDNGVLLSIGPQHSFAIESLFKMLHPGNARYLLEQAVVAAPVFGVRWRWNITRSLAVLRAEAGRRVPPFLQKFRSEDLLAAAFPETVGCLENHHGDIEIPYHQPIVKQTMHDCLTEAMDVERWIELLADVQSGKVELIPVETREPSPFSHQLINANPYAFLDDAPLEERRTRAVTTRRSLSIDDFRDLARLDPDAIAQVSEDAWPVVRDAEELHDALNTMVVLREEEASTWSDWLMELASHGRASLVEVGGNHKPEAQAKESPATSPNGVSFACASGLWRRLWIAAERWPLIKAVFPEAKAAPVPVLPAALDKAWESADARVEIVRGRIQFSGPTTAADLAEKLSLTESQVFAALEAVEASGGVMRGRFTPQAQSETDVVQWCDRRLLARIHRMTLDGLRRKIEPVPPEVYLDFLVRRHGLLPGHERRENLGVREAISQLQGFELPAGAWEDKVLAPRIADYDPPWLDALFLSGELAWGRLRPPKRDEKNGPGMAALNRTMPIALALRDDLPWLLPAERQSLESFASSAAREVLHVLDLRGALFYREIASLTGLLPTQLEDALRELAALGLVSSDTFAAVRHITAGQKKTLRRHGVRSMHSVASPVGRWSRFPGAIDLPQREAAVERWCRQLLARYGVVFRDLLTREPAAPPWYELVRVLRRLELRGEVRGGRFIAQVAGEQFALESVVSQLRELRDQPPDQNWAIVSAADPVNLCGILTAGNRIPATHKNYIVLQSGRCVAAKITGRIEFFVGVAPEVEAAMRRALQYGRRITSNKDPSLHRFRPRTTPVKLADDAELNSRRRFGW